MKKRLSSVFAAIVCVAIVFSLLPVGMISYAEPVSWRVIYNLNGAAGEAPQDPTLYSATTNQAVILDISAGTNVVPPAGKRFAGWTPVKALADIGVANDYYAPGKTMKLSTNALSLHGAELFAVWEAIPAGPFTVSFRTKIASLKVDSQIIADGGKVTPPAALEYPKYKFVGWYTDSYFREAYKWNFETDVVKDNITLHAKWEEDFDPANVPWTVTYHLSAGVTGEVPASQTVAPNNGEGGSAIVRDLAAGTVGPEGKVFAGWCTTPKRIVELKPGDSLWVKHEGIHLYDVWLDANPVYSNATTVKFDDVKQRMTGLGDSVAFHRSAAYLQMLNKFRDAGYPDSENPAYKLLKLAFDPKTGAGMDVFRVIIGDGGIIDPVNKTKWNNQYSDGPSDSVWPEPGIENLVWVREDWANHPERVAKFDEDQVWFMKEILKINPNVKINAASWTAPYWMKTNLGVRNDSPYDPYPVAYHGRHDDTHPLLGEEFYDDFAQYLVEYAWGMYAWLGIPIYALSPTNEPEIDHPYSAMVLHGDDYERFLLDYLKPAFDKAVAAGRFSAAGTGAGTGYGAVAPMPLISAPEGTRIDRSTAPVDIGTCDRTGYGAMMANPEIQDFVKIFGTHVYEYTQFRYEPQVAEAGYFYPDYMYKYPAIWMNEISRQWATYGGGVNDINMKNGLHWARLINNLFASEPGFSSYQFWFGITGGLYSLQSVGSYSHSGQIRIQKRFYTLAQYSKFIDDGYFRVGVTERVPFKGGNVTAYKNGDDLSVVILNEDDFPHTITLKLDGNGASSLVPYRTSDNENLRKLPAIAAVDGTFTVTLPALSITTLVNDKGENNVPGLDIRDGNFPLYPADNDGQSDAGAVAEDNAVLASNGGWIRYKNFNFSDGTIIATTTANRIMRLVADVTPISGGVIEARIDGPEGKLVGLVKVPEGGAEAYNTMIDTGDKAAYGFHDLYLVFKGGSGELFSLNQIKFDNVYMAPEGNLVTNGIFANPVTAWEGIGATVARAATPAFRTGQGSLLVSARGAGSGAAQTITGLENGASYKLDAYVLPPVPSALVTNDTPHASTYAECGDAEVSLIFYKDGVQVAKQALVKREKVSNVEWAQLQSEFVYKAPEAAFDSVKLMFTTSTEDNFYLAGVSLVKVEQIAAVKALPDNLVATYGANIKVLVEGLDLDGHTVEAFVVKDGTELAGAAVKFGEALINVKANVLNEVGVYDIVVKVDGALSNVKGSINVVTYNPEIWTPAAKKGSDGKLCIEFADKISPSPKGMSVVIDGAAHTCVISDKVLYVENVIYDVIPDGAAISVSGVKYAHLFPSYSFTFNIKLKK